MVVLGGYPRALHPNSEKGVSVNEENNIIFFTENDNYAKTRNHDMAGGEFLQLNGQGDFRLQPYVFQI